MEKRSRNARNFRKPHYTPPACAYHESKTEPDYKEPSSLTKFLTERGKIIGRERSGLCASHQKKLTIAVKRARHLALFPFVVRD